MPENRLQVSKLLRQLSEVNWLRLNAGAPAAHSEMCRDSRLYTYACEFVSYPHLKTVLTAFERHRLAEGAC
jgi:hypothetical protein